MNAADFEDFRFLGALEPTPRRSSLNSFVIVDTFKFQQTGSRSSAMFRSSVPIFEAV